jgi:hypothetical protein
LSFSYEVLVPANQVGFKQILGECEYQLAGMMNPATHYATPNPLVIGLCCITRPTTANRSG